MCASERGSQDFLGYPCAELTCEPSPNWCHDAKAGEQKATTDAMREILTSHGRNRGMVYEEVRHLFDLMRFDINSNQISQIALDLYPCFNCANDLKLNEGKCTTYDNHLNMCSWETGEIRCVKLHETATNRIC